jgi:hypothetical protein
MRLFPKSEVQISAVRPVFGQMRATASTAFRLSASYVTGSEDRSPDSAQSARMRSAARPRSRSVNFAAGGDHFRGGVAGRSRARAPTSRGHR